MKDVPKTTSGADADSPASTPVVQKQDLRRPPSPETTIHPPRLPRGLKSSTRELSSSIASNLASARGIPSNRQKRPTPISPLVSTQTADGHIVQDDARGKSFSIQYTDASDDLLSQSSLPHARPSWAPPISPTTRPVPAEPAKVQGSDAPFQQFYATFESLMSKLSAPLAFAGLPLSTPPTAKPPSTPSQPSPKAPKAPSNPNPALPPVDYSQLISHAALRAVSDSTSNNPSESFYVVPTTGGTISYAEIMSRAEREEARAGFRSSHHRRTSNLTNISEDDFVDAQSTILPHGPRGSGEQPSRFRRNAQEEVKVNGKTMEELSMENQALKHLSDTLSKRLHVFEMSAQTSSAALVQSIRSLHNRSPMLSPESSRGKPISGKTMVGLDSGPEEATHRRIADLEEILRKSDARARKKEEENVKLKEAISRYREKWESLKAGAKARRERERGGGGRRSSEAGSRRHGPEKASEEGPEIEEDESVAGL